MNKIRNLKFELAKIENFIQHYKDIQNENVYLKEANNSKEIEINAMYNLIQKLNNEKDKFSKMINKYEIDLKKINKEQK